jgi:hypothetical protein
MRMTIDLIWVAVGALVWLQTPLQDKKQSTFSYAPLAAQTRKSPFCSLEWRGASTERYRDSGFPFRHSHGGVGSPMLHIPTPRLRVAPARASRSDPCRPLPCSIRRVMRWRPTSPTFSSTTSLARSPAPIVDRQRGLVLQVAGDGDHAGHFLGAEHHRQRPRHPYRLHLGYQFLMAQGVVEEGLQPADRRVERDQRPTWDVKLSIQCRPLLTPSCRPDHST